jgi:hypothetical protein
MKTQYKQFCFLQVVKQWVWSGADSLLNRAARGEVAGLEGLEYSSEEGNGLCWWTSLAALAADKNASELIGSHEFEFETGCGCLHYSRGVPAAACSSRSSASCSRRLARVRDQMPMMTHRRASSPRQPAAPWVCVAAMKMQTSPAFIPSSCMWPSSRSRTFAIGSCRPPRRRKSSVTSMPTNTSCCPLALLGLVLPFYSGLDCSTRH